MIHMWSNTHIQFYVQISKNRPPMYSEVGALSQMPFFVFVFVFCLGDGFKPEKMFWKEEREAYSP